MNNEDYVSYELALKLKACGFDEPCDRYWYKVFTNSNEMEMRQGKTIDYNNDGWFVPHCSAPTLWRAQKWLREVKRCDVTVYAQPYNGLPYYTGYILFEGDETEVLDDNGQWFDDYEEALSKTIAAALELIEQEKK